ncbi:MAG: adenylate/guanylate cyclase domain-containing protein [Chloroflexota bacterium]
MTNRPINTYSKSQRYGQAGRNLAKRLAAYLPMTVTRQILNEELGQPGQVRWITAATLFADISGFTSMSEALAVDGPRGAETLNRRLLMTFTALINAIHDAGGAVSHFHGDAMMVYFPDSDGRAAGRALGCARFMQSLMLTSYAEFDETPSGRSKKTFSLTMRIGLGYGRCVETIVGDPNHTMEFVLAGDAIDEAVEAEGKATAGQVVASQHILKMANLPFTEPFRVVEEVPPVPRANSPLYWDSFSQSAMDSVLTIAPAFLPKILVERLKNPNTQFVAEHRPATSMFVKFEGIDFKSEKSGQQLQEYYQWVWQVIERYGGDNSHLNRILTGDKGSHLHIIFGAPIAPDAPEQAIRCALALQRNRPKFITKQQIGLSTGRVFACAVGSQNRREYTTVGSVVNLSSRLSGLCQDGSVLTDQHTADRVREIFVFDTVENVKIKGVKGLSKLFVPIEERTITAQARSRFAQPQKIPLGRDEEMAVLESYLQDGLQGHGEAIVLYGPFGSGQIGLLGAGVHYWQIRKGRVLSGVSQQHFGQEAFSPWYSVFQSLFELSESMDTVELRETIKEFFEIYLPSFDGDSSLFGLLLGKPELLSAFVSRLPLDNQIDELFPKAAVLLHQIAIKRPLLIVLEDIHWADEQSMRLLDYLSRELAECPITFLITYRESPDFVFFNEERETQYRQLHLHDLDPDKALAIVRQQLRSETLPKVLEQRLGIRDRDGRLSPVNPLFLEESLKFILSEGVLDVGDEKTGGHRLRVQETAMLNLQVPDRVYAILLSRLDQLSPDVRSLLQTAAVIGRSFDLKTLVSVSSSIDHDEAKEAVETLIANDIIEQDGYATEQKYIFSHALAHDVAYQSIPYARRQKLHASIGDLIVQDNQDDLEPHYPLLAYHFGQTDRHETGLIYAIAAGDAAAESFDNEVASNYYRRAVYHLSLLNEKTHWQTAVHVLMSRAKVNRLRGEFQRATQAGNDALKLCLLYGSTSHTLPIYNLLAEIKYDQARYTDGMKLADKVINTVAPNMSEVDLAQAYLVKGVCTAALHNLAGALSLLYHVEEISAVQKNKAQLITAWQAMGMVYSHQNQLELARKTAKEAVALAREQRLPALISTALFNQSRIQMRNGEPEDALEAINEGIELAANISKNWYAHMLVHRAAIHVYFGQLATAQDDLKKSVALLETMDDGLGLLRARLMWGVEYYRAQDNWPAVQKQLVQVGELIAEQKGGSEVHLPEAARLWLGLSHTAFKMGEFDQAKQLLAKAMRVIDVNQLHWWRPNAFYLKGLIESHEFDDPRHAQNSLKLAVHYISEGGNPDELPLILMQLADVTEDDLKKHQLIEACIVAAQKRSRFFDKLDCYRKAGPTLSECDDPRLQQLGNMCLAFVESTMNDIEA